MHVFPDGKPRWVMPAFLALSAATVFLPSGVAGNHQTQHRLAQKPAVVTPGPTSEATVTSTVTLTPNPTQRVVVQSQVVKKIVTKTITVTAPAKPESQATVTVTPTPTPTSPPQIPVPEPSAKPPAPSQVPIANDPVSAVLQTVQNVLGPA